MRLRISSGLFPISHDLYDSLKIKSNIAAIKDKYVEPLKRHQFFDEDSPGKIASADNQQVFHHLFSPNGLILSNTPGSEIFPAI